MRMADEVVLMDTLFQHVWDEVEDRALEGDQVHEYKEENLRNKSELLLKMNNGKPVC
jgi:hypothetical protein